MAKATRSPSPTKPALYTYDYNAFGEITEQTGTTENPYRYIGEKGYQYNKETADYYVRARTYEPKIARWLSADPLGFADGPCVYCYVSNQSVVNSDPSGLAPYWGPCCDCSCKDIEFIPIGWRGYTVNYGGLWKAFAYVIHVKVKTNGACGCTVTQEVDNTMIMYERIGRKWKWTDVSKNTMDKPYSDIIIPTSKGSVNYPLQSTNRCRVGICKDDYSIEYMDGIGVRFAGSLQGTWRSRYGNLCVGLNMHLRVKCEPEGTEFAVTKEFKGDYYACLSKRHLTRKTGFFGGWIVPGEKVNLKDYEPIYDD